jgi:hypothetical protein
MSLTSMPLNKKCVARSSANTNADINVEYLNDIYDSIYTNVKMKSWNKLEKVETETMSIPKFNEYNMILQYNYNVQQLKSIISHYKLNIKTFVINNGGYVSMKKWQDSFFEGNRLDTKEATGVGTLNFKDIAKAFNIKYLLIKKVSDIKKKILQIQNNNYPYLIEVVTDPNQKIYGKEF